MHRVVEGGKGIIIESYVYTQVFGGMDGDDRNKWE